jgi:pimeloyl-ACP methyl ester carboxylesterase
MFHSSATGRRRERIFPEAPGLRQARHPRDDTAGSAGIGQSVVIPGCGHYCLEEAPEEVVAALTAFLAPYRESI